MKKEITTLLIGNGSGTCKAEFAGNEAPGAHTPPLLVAPDTRALWWAWARGTPVYIEEETQSKKGILTLNLPTKHGIVSNWYMEI